MSIWDLYERKLKISGNTTRDRQINSFKNSITNDFQNSPSYFDIYLNDNTEATGVQIVDNSSVLNEKNDDIKMMIMQPNDSLSVGDLITWNSQKWLVTAVEKVGNIYFTGQIIECNNTLTFYKNGILLEVPCVVSGVGNSLGFNTDETKFVSDLSDFVLVRVPNNEISQLIQINDIFPLGRRNFKVTNDSDIIESGLLIFKMKVVAQEAESHIYVLTILNGSDLSINNTQVIQLNTQVTDNNSIMFPTPTISYTSSNTAICTINSLGLITPIATGNCTIFAKLTSDLTISDNISVEVIALPQNNFSYTLTGNIQPDTELKLNQIKTYVAQKYNNGSPIVQTFAFSVIGDLTAYQLTIIDGNNVSIKALKSTGSITLRALDNSDGVTYKDKVIQLKNIF